MLGTYGDTARPWEEIVAHFKELTEANAGFRDMATLVAAIASSPFRRAGLCGLTSVCDLILGPSTQVLDNPHLVISPDFQQRSFELIYRDGSARPWTRRVSANEAFDVVVRFLTKRARWYRATPETPNV